MIKKALEYIVGLGEAKVQTIHGDTYSDKPLTHIEKHVPKADPITMRTLSSLVTYIKANVDTMADKMIVHVVSPTEVNLISQMDVNRDRETVVRVAASLPTFRFGSFLGHEEFLIGVQSKFIDEGDKDLILKFAGTVESGSVAEYGDDGITQKATIKTGIASKNEAIVPNPVKLTPFRTFVEVDQPSSQFIFRMKQEKYDGISCALFEADGGAWVNEAMLNIKLHLMKELEGYSNFVVIS